MKNELFAKLPQMTPEEITKKVEVAKTKVDAAAVTAKDYFDKVTAPVKETKVIAKLSEDIEENPKKVATEAGIAAAVGTAVFAGLRVWDAYKDEVGKPVEKDTCETVVEEYGPAVLFEVE